MKKKLLVIDDSEVVQRQIKIFCSLLGIDVICTDDLQVGLSLVESERFDAILLDIRLGDYHLKEEDLKKLSQFSQQIVLMSADFIENESLPFLLKPFTATDLEKLILK